jgi:flavin-binding protein dodecin
MREAPAAADFAHLETRQGVAWRPPGTVEDAMTEHVYKLTEIVGTSHESHDAAIKAALGRAQKSLRNIRWFEVVGQRGYVDGEAIVHQVTLKIGFTLE